MRVFKTIAATALLGAAALLTGCWAAGDNEVVVYAALDREFSEPILDRFTADTGISVRAVYDKESTKTVGLTNRILGERKKPQCDLFWNNEIKRAGNGAVGVGLAGVSSALIQQVSALLKNFNVRCPLQL